MLNNILVIKSPKQRCMLLFSTKISWKRFPALIYFLKVNAFNWMTSWNKQKCRSFQPVCVLLWAWSDLSLGNTRLQIVHRMSLREVEPFHINDEIASARGRPLFIIWRRNSESPSSEDDADALNWTLCTFSPQFHGYIFGSLIAVRWRRAVLTSIACADLLTGVRCEHAIKSVPASADINSVRASLQNEFSRGLWLTGYR